MDSLHTVDPTAKPAVEWELKSATWAEHVRVKGRGVREGQRPKGKERGKAGPNPYPAPAVPSPALCEG